MKVKIITLGCKVNQYESQAMLENLLSSGFQPAENGDTADIVILNSCTVTATSDQKVRQTLRHAKRENSSAITVLTGCMPQAFPEDAKGLAEADIVLGTAGRASLVPHILEYLSAKQRIVDIAPHESGEVFEPMQVSAFREHTRAFLKIEDGCNRFCSYCIIPYARGRVRSKPLDDLRTEVRTLAKNGYREIVLTGINLSAYGQELNLHLCDAVEAVCAEDGISRVRLGSLEPEQLSDDVILRLSRQKKLCPQFHLSLQSGCDATLARMNRHYSTAEYRYIVAALRSAFENAAITTDIMVGFAGETDEEFEQSLAFAKEIGFAKVHVFAYSRRPGTKAYDAPDQCQNSLKEARSREMIRLTKETQKKFFLQQTGRTEEVLFEREKDKNLYEGYTKNYTPVVAVSSQPLQGKIISAKIVAAQDDFCVADLTAK